MIGQIINYRYEVLEKVGDGQIFSVYRARDKVLNRLVALKVLTKGLAENRDFAKAVRSGYSSVAGLNHPSIARVIEADPASEDPFIACEYVRGINVKDRVTRAGQMAVPLALDISISALEALQYAHDHGISHGNLRSQDVVVSPDGEVKVTDFGLAGALSKCPEVASQYAMRSAHYQAPELGEGAEPSSSSDLYSIGTILYEMLTGSLPFDGPTPVAVALKQIKNDPVAPRELNAAIPKSLSDVILRAIESNPENRFPNAVEMLTDLRAIRDALKIGKPLSIPQPAVSAKQGGAAESVLEAAEPSLRRPLMWLVLLFMLAFLTTLGLTMYLQGGRTHAKVPPILGMTMDEAKVEADKLGLTIEEDSEDGGSRVFSAVYDEGKICAVKPGVGSSVPGDNIIKVKISKGASEKRAPMLTGLPESEAYSAAQNAGFSVGKISFEFSDKVPMNSVVSQKPPMDTMTPAGSSIDIVVSKGPKPDETTTDDTSGSGDTARDNNSADTSKVENYDVYITIPSAEKDPQEVKIVVNDDRGETTVYQEFKNPGEKFKQTVPTYGDSPRIRAYVGDKLFYDETPQR